MGTNYVQLCDELEAENKRLHSAIFSTIAGFEDLSSHGYVPYWESAFPELEAVARADSGEAEPRGEA